MNEPVVEGQVLAGKYRVERVLGRGGMGVVVAAMHLQLAQRVAIKILIQPTPDFLTRFLREARASVRLKSEHVARVLDVGELPDGAPYMVMEFLDGTDLSGVIHTRGALPVIEAVDYLLQALEGVAEAHAVGIVHRDLKPANLFLTRAADGSNTVKVLDFGISTAAADDDTDTGLSLTKTSSMLGSPLYMSPEQLKSARLAGPRSDVWSLGAILYELLAARVPFYTTTFSELVLMVNMDQPPPLATFRNDVPAGLEAVILRCLEKKPEGRFANVGELAWALVPFARPEARLAAERVARTLATAGVIVTPPSAPSGGPASVAAPSAPASVSAGGAPELPAMASTAATTQGNGARGGRGAMIAGGAALLAIGGAAAFFLLGAGPEPAPVTAAATAEVAPPPTTATASVGATGATIPVVAPAPSEAPSALPAAAPSASAATTPATAPVRKAAPAKPASAPTGAPEPAAPPPQQKKNPLEMQLK